MLRYVSDGERWYHRNPVPVYSRPYWEFEAVLAGEMAPVFEGQPPTMQQNRLWVFPPTHPHGWIGQPNAPSEVFVVHYVSVPEPLHSIAIKAGYLSLPLTSADRDWLRAQAQYLGEELAKPTDLGALRAHHALLGLSLMALRDHTPRTLPPEAGRQRRLVEAALTWYSEHLADGPSLERVAKAIHVSPSHLRRLFHRVFKMSPRECFSKLRLERAIELMANEQMSLEAVADACGFSDASAFSRAFRQRYGRPPSEWRRES